MGADFAVQGFGRLNIVVEDIGLCGEDRFKAFGSGVKIRCQYFNDKVWGAIRAQSADDFGEMLGTFVRKVVARDAGDDDMFETELFRRLGDARGFVRERIEGLAAPGGDRAEIAGARAAFAENHERRRAA